MKWIVLTVFAAFGLCIATSSHADELSLEVAYTCDPENSRFALMADVDADSPQAKPYGVEEEQRATRLTRGSHKIECEWKGVKIVADVLSWRAGQGMCQGAGGARIKKLEINGQEHHFHEPELHSFPNCFGDAEGLVKVMVESSDGEIHVHSCIGRGWGWTSGWPRAKCVKRRWS